MQAFYSFIRKESNCPNFIAFYNSFGIRVKKILGLPRGAEINMVISCGIRKPEGIYGPRFRVPFQDVYFEV